MTPEQIDKDCDAIVEKYLKEIDLFTGSRESHSIILATKLAILHQTGIVEEYDKILKSVRAIKAMNPIVERLTEAKQILETLKSRLK